MTGHPDRPDVAQRRRVTRLRVALGLATVPPYVGRELGTATPVVADQVVRLLRQEPAFEALSPAGRKRLLAVVVRALEAFALLVEDRPPHGPAVESMLLALVHAEGQLEACHAALHASFQTVREVTRVLWPQLPLASTYTAQLDLAMAEYAKRLCRTTMRIPPTRDNRPVEARSDEAKLDVLLSLVRHRWGAEAGQLFLSVSTIGVAGTSAQPTATPRQPVDRATAHGVHVTITDHVVIVTKHPVPPPRASSTTDAPVVVSTGPVTAGEIAVVHDTALLLLRLIGAGIAAPPSPVRVAMPNLGFLHPCPSQATVRKIVELRRPLTEQGLHRRVALARTLQARLRSAAPVQGLAKLLVVHPQTVHNHIAALRVLYNHDLDFGDDTLPMQAALDLVLPLWELEAEGTGARRHRMPGNPPETTPIT